MQTETRSPPSNPRLRWYQYRLRTLLILMTLLAVWMAWISHRARQQKLAVEKIMALGGTVNYDFQIEPDSAKYFGIECVADSNASPPGPEWLRNFIGDDYFQNVVWVNLCKTSVSDDDLEILENLPALKMLALDETKITGRGLSHLKGLKNLENLFLQNTLIDDNGLANLQNFNSLLWITLEGPKYTDGSLKHLKNFKKLESLHLINTRVTKKGAASIEKDLPKTKIVCGTEYIY